MTENISLVKQKRKHRPPAVSDALVGCFAFFCLLLLLKNSELAMEYITRGLILCAKVVIPSLFPFMVLSELIVSGGLADRIPRRLLLPLCRLLRLPPSGCCAVLLGLLCGFPVGARSAVCAYQRGELDRDGCERVLLCASPPSSAFLISAVGVSLFGNRRFGYVLYALVLAVSLLFGILFAHIGKKETSGRHKVDQPDRRSSTALQGAALFTSSVKGSLGSILSVCAYVVFFSAIMGAFHTVLGTFGASQAVSAFLCCLLELSGGVSLASALPDRLLGACLCAFAVGWSGISVHCQMLGVCEGAGLSTRRYLLAKLLQGLVLPLLLGAVLACFPELLLGDAVF